MYKYNIKYKNCIKNNKTNIINSFCPIYTNNIENGEFKKEALKKCASAYINLYKWIKEYLIHDGIKIYDIVERIENKIIAMNEIELVCPVSVTYNNIINFTPDKSNFSDLILTKNDVISLDIILCNNSIILDESAIFSLSDEYNSIINLSVDNVRKIINNVSINKPIAEVCAVLPTGIRCGYQLLPHGRLMYGKQLFSSSKNIMEENESYFICYPIVRNTDCIEKGNNFNVYYKVGGITDSWLYKIIDNNFDSYFCRRWLDNLGCKKYMIELNKLFASNIIDKVYYMTDKSESVVTKYGKTIMVTKDGIDVFVPFDIY